MLSEERLEEIRRLIEEKEGWHRAFPGQPDGTIVPMRDLLTGVERLCEKNTRLREDETEKTACSGTWPTSSDNTRPHGGLPRE